MRGRKKVHKNASYSRLLEKCIKAVWEEDEGYNFSLMDGQGLLIDDKLIIDQPNGIDEELPWTLETYLKITKRTYTTQPRFVVLRTPDIGE